MRHGWIFFPMAFFFNYTIIIHLIFLSNVVSNKCTYLNHFHFTSSFSFSCKNDHNMIRLCIRLIWNYLVFLVGLEDTPYLWFGGGRVCYEYYTLFIFLTIYIKVCLYLTNENVFRIISSNPIQHKACFTEKNLYEGSYAGPYQVLNVGLNEIPNDDMNKKCGNINTND